MDHPEDPRTYAIIGAAMDVHNEMGPGFLERVYHDALVFALEDRGIAAEREVPYQLSYRGRPLGHPYRADLVCENGVLVEVKAHDGIGNADLSQVIHYLRASGLSTGLLLNFGLPRLQHRRFVLGGAWRKDIGAIGDIGGPLVP
jgi:GxxExxY protein